MKAPWRTYRSWSITPPTGSAGEGVDAARPVDPSRALAVDRIPRATALVLALIAIDPLVRAIEERRRLRRSCEEIVREASAYRPAAEQQMDDRLDATRLLLLQHGFVPRGMRGPLPPEELGHDEQPRTAEGAPKDPVQVRYATTMARAVKRVLHPDRCTGLPPVLDDGDVADAIARAKAADLRADVAQAYEVLLESLPRYHYTKVVQRLIRGHRLEDIVNGEPSIVDDLRWLLWLSAQPGLRLSDLPRPDPRAAHLEAKRIRGEADRLALAHAYALAYAAFEDVLNYRHSIPTDATGLETLTEALQFMARVGFDLWQTEATISGMDQGSVLVKRLHGGVGREVRDVGDAVHHAAKVLTPESVWPESMASAAAALRRAVTWVENALIQFKMALRATERPPFRAALDVDPVSSLSGLPTRIR